MPIDHTIRDHLLLLKASCQSRYKFPALPLLLLPFNDFLIFPRVLFLRCIAPTFLSAFPPSYSLFSSSFSHFSPLFARLPRCLNCRFQDSSHSTFSFELNISREPTPSVRKWHVTFHGTNAVSKFPCNITYSEFTVLSHPPFSISLSLSPSCSLLHSRPLLTVHPSSFGSQLPSSLSDCHPSLKNPFIFFWGTSVTLNSSCTDTLQTSSVSIEPLLLWYFHCISPIQSSFSSDLDHPRISSSITRNYHWATISFSLARQWVMD